MHTSTVKVNLALFVCRCVSLQTTTRAMTESWACVFVDSLQEEVHVTARAEEDRQQKSSSSVERAE